MKEYTIAEKQYLLGLGSKIRELRNTKRMKLHETAALCNSQKATHSRIETGKTNPTIMSLKKIADVLQVPMSALFINTAI
jgi:transcriptional regulator with XRE-family HTH domain